MKRLAFFRLVLAAAVAACVSAAGVSAAEPSLAEARQLFLHGSYAEAGEMYGRLAEEEPVAAAVGQARCLAAVGDAEKAVLLLSTTAKTNESAGALRSESALLALERGDYKTAEADAQAALGLLKSESAKAQSKWVLAELRRRDGRLDEANLLYKSLVEIYNAEDEIKDADALRYIGLGAAQYARWNRLSDQFHFLVNELYPDILKLDKDYWPAHYEAGLLYLEKFNQAEAAAEFKAALAINPHAAEVHAAVASLALQNYELTEAQAALKRALEINPHLIWAHQLQADVQLANFEPGDVVKSLEAALKLNPLDEQTLGRLAAAYAGLDGVPEKLAGTRLGRLIEEATARNPHAGEFFESLADGLDELRRYPDAARFYREAIAHMPQLIAPRGQLGLVYMRLGNEVEADKVLRESFDIDLFNVRVSNTLKVLEVLSSYAAIETDHFVIKFDRAHDEILAKYAAKYLEEEVYPQLVKKFGFQPEGKSLFEIFSRAKNTDGHGWFSARMVGLPYIGTVGACAGRMVAMQSPNDARQKFNWSRVLRHEFVHVVNLQQTHFNIPHWFTEALAVQNEGFSRPRQWNELLIDRVPKGKLYNLETINTGFIRPKSSDEWAMAYCQAELYADYMLERFGADSLAKMLAAYADNVNTRTAIRRSFGIEQPDFEKGYVEYLHKVVERLGQGGKSPKEESQQLKALAREYLKAGDDQKLFGVLEKLADFDPDDVAMRKKLAQLSLAQKNFDAAAHWAKQSLYIDVEDVDTHRMLAEALVGQKNYSATATELEVAVKLDPKTLSFQLTLADAYVHSGQIEKGRGALKAILAADPKYPGATEMLQKLKP
jgi:cellulose synthase operon protein C